MKFNELSAEAKAVFGILEIEDRLYTTQAQALTVNQKQFEGCLEFLNYPKQTNYCAKRKGCKARGRCSLVGRRCRVTKDEDCAQSVMCKKYGKCSADRGRCVKR